MGWLLVAVVLGLFAWAAIEARRVELDRRDRWESLSSLAGRRVTVVAGFKWPVDRTGTLILREDARRARLLFGRSIVLDDGERGRSFPIREVYLVKDPETGATLAGPWA